MMKFYMEQHFMSIRQNFEIYDEAGNVVYQVRGRMPWLRRQMTIGHGRQRIGPRRQAH